MVFLLQTGGKREAGIASEELQQASNRIRLVRRQRWAGLAFPGEEPGGTSERQQGAWHGAEGPWQWSQCPWMHTEGTAWRPDKLSSVA